MDTSSKTVEDNKCPTKGKKTWKTSNLRRSLRKCYYQASLCGIKNPCQKMFEQLRPSVRFFQLLPSHFLRFHISRRKKEVRREGEIYGGRKWCDAPLVIQGHWEAISALVVRK